MSGLLWPLEKNPELLLQLNLHATWLQAPLATPGASLSLSTTPQAHRSSLSEKTKVLSSLWASCCSIWECPAQLFTAMTLHAESHGSSIPDSLGPLDYRRRGTHTCSVASVMSNSLQPYGPQPTRLLCSGDSPGKNTRVGCHALLQVIFPAQGSNLFFLHCRQILYCWADPKGQGLAFIWGFSPSALVCHPHPLPGGFWGTYCLPPPCLS